VSRILSRVDVPTACDPVRCRHQFRQPKSPPVVRLKVPFTFLMLVFGLFPPPSLLFSACISPPSPGFEKLRRPRSAYALRDSRERQRRVVLFPPVAIADLYFFLKCRVPSPPF